MAGGRDGRHGELTISLSPPELSVAEPAVSKRLRLRSAAAESSAVCFVDLEDNEDSLDSNDCALSSSLTLLRPLDCFSGLTTAELSAVDAAEDVAARATSLAGFCLELC